MNVKVRILLSIGILTILGAIFIFGELIDEMHHDPEYTAGSSAVYTDEYGVFYMENWNGMGRLYRIDSSGKVLAMANSKSVKMEKAEQVAYSEGRVFAVYSKEDQDKDGAYRTYRVVSYDEDLSPVSLSGLFTLDPSWRVCSVTADSMDVTVSAIEGNGGAVSVYSLPVRTLHSIESYDFSDDTPEKKNDDPITREDFETPESIMYRERTAERFFVNAKYVNPELYVLLDGDTPSGIFAPDVRIKTAVDEIGFTFGQWLSLHASLIIKIVGVLLIWVILLILTVRLTKNKDRIVYLYSASVVIFFFILLCAFLFIRNQFQKNEISNNTGFAVMVMQDDLQYYSGVDYTSDDFYDSTKYYRLMDSLTHFISEREVTEVFHDAFVMQLSSGIVRADARGNCGIHASYLYGGEMSAMLEQLAEDPDPVTVSLTLDGEKLFAVGYRSDNAADDLALVAICKNTTVTQNYNTSMKWLRVLFIVIFVIGSILLFIALYLQHLDLKRFSKALKGLALGQPKEDTPKEVARDMRELWQCYGELTQRIEEINYEKFRIFEAYYRFAPKGIEKIMGRESIFDVGIGDLATVSGAVALLTIDKDREFEHKVQSLSSIITTMEKYAMQENDAMLVSRDQALSNVRFLVLKESAEMISQIVQFIYSGSLLGIDGWSVLVYRDVLTYGVAGSKSQSLTYIDSDFSREMDPYAEWFRKMGVPLVVTERVVKSGDVGEKRYVGCARFSGGENRVEFYEILDAYPATTRQLMLINRTKFEETLQMYYQRNFYLARNQFMEILKDCPEDGIVKWYIFECEKYMNGEGDLSQSEYIDLD